MVFSDARGMVLALLAGVVLFVAGYLLGAQHVFPGVDCFFGIGSPSVICR